MIFAIPLCGQTFEVASIRHNLSGDERDAGINILPGGRISGTNLTLKTPRSGTCFTTCTVDFAALTGASGEYDMTGYYIAAKTGSGENIGLEQLQPLLQHLLADRFQGKAAVSRRGFARHVYSYWWSISAICTLLFRFILATRLDPRALSAAAYEWL